VLNVLVTGANRGLGLELARQYAASGERVFAAVRNPGAATALQELAREYPGISVHATDQDAHATICALAAELHDQPIDVLVCNAGMYGEAQESILGLSYASMLETYRVNTLGPMCMAEAFLPHVARSHKKCMVAITSGMGSISETSGGSYAYRASKAALNMSFRNLAIELRPRGITVFVMNPGWVQTDMGGRGAPTRVEDSIAGMRKVIAGITLAETGTFKDFRGGTIAW
jgi:NAD(P)-dependent dehydrogenase (short-subunit alcohol dehydrogenase family)